MCVCGAVGSGPYAKRKLAYSSYICELPLPNVMPAKDFYHHTVRRALEKDGWTITDDPIYLPFITTFLQIDLGAKRLEVSRGEIKIAVEVKNFREPNAFANEFHKAIGQMITYLDVLATIDPAVTTYLAITEDAYSRIFSQPAAKSITTKRGIKLLVFNPITETITQWDA